MERAEFNRIQAEPASSEARRGAKARQIGEAAARLFLAQGFAVTSMDAVAAEARVSKRTLYQYFPSKEVLFVTVIQQELEDLLSTLALQVREGAEPDLEALAVAWVRHAFAPRLVALYRSVIAEAERLPQLTRALDAAIMEPIEKALATMIGRMAERAGRPMAEPVIAADALVGLLLGTNQIRMLLALAPLRDRQGLEAYARERVQLFLRAFDLMPKSAARPPRR